MKIFSKKKFELAEPSKYTWQNEANGREVIEGGIKGTSYICFGSKVDKWCVDSAPLMESFKNEKIAVRFPEEWQRDTFLDMCEEAGVNWSETEKASARRYYPYGIGTCYSFGYHDNFLAFAPRHWYVKHGWKSIDYLDFIDLAVEDKLTKIWEEHLLAAICDSYCKYAACSDLSQEEVDEKCDNCPMAEIGGRR